MKATATRINYLHVSARTKTGAPRMFQAKEGTYDQKHVCMCPNGGSGCSHEQALYALLHSEAATMQAQATHVVA